MRTEKQRPSPLSASAFTLATALLLVSLCKLIVLSVHFALSFFFSCFLSLAPVIILTNQCNLHAKQHHCSCYPFRSYIFIIYTLPSLIFAVTLPHQPFISIVLPHSPHSGNARLPHSHSSTCQKTRLLFYPPPLSSCPSLHTVLSPLTRKPLNNFFSICPLR